MRSKTVRVACFAFVLVWAAGCGDDDRPVSRTDGGGGGDTGMPPIDGGGRDTGGGGGCVGVDCSAMDDECNMGVCNPATGDCEQEPLADGTTCDDGDDCTMGDTCGAGTCDGTPRDCSASS